MLRKLKISLYVILISITLTLSSVVGVFGAFNANIENGIYLTYEFVQIPVNLTKSSLSGTLKVRRDTAISWDESEQAAKVLAHDIDGVNESNGLSIHDVAIYVNFGNNVIDTSTYKVVVMCCKWINGCTYTGTSTIFPLIDNYNSNEKTSFQKSFTIPYTEDYTYIIVDFTNFTVTRNDVTYNYEGGNLTGFRFDYFETSSDDLAEQGLYIKSITMCQTIEAAERLFGSN